MKRWHTRRWKHSSMPVYQTHTCLTRGPSSFFTSILGALSTPLIFFFCVWLFHFLQQGSLQQPLYFQWHKLSLLWLKKKNPKCQYQSKFIINLSLHPCTVKGPLKPEQWWQFKTFQDRSVISTYIFFLQKRTQQLIWKTSMYKNNCIYSHILHKIWEFAADAEHHISAPSAGRN